ncbi:MAG: 4Fe-4S binding protein [Clostridia bacterium]|nr:4Fe-4S binding protein [Clostridia bacterium]
MEKVYYYTGSGHSRAVAEYIAEGLGRHTEDITVGEHEAEDGAVTVVVFPVYCENMPDAVAGFLGTVKTGSAAVAAVYGGISPGNVLFEAQSILKRPLIAAAAVFAGHSFLSEGNSFDRETLDGFVGKIKKPAPVAVPPMRRSFYADFAPGWRSRVGLKIVKNDGCTECGKCEENCPVGAIFCGTPSNGCIRCLRCVSTCPANALSFECRPFLRRYLERKKKEKSFLYI